MLAFNQKVSRLFNSNIKLFLLEFFSASNHDEELIRDVYISLELELKGHISFIRCDSCIINCDTRVPLLAFKCPLVFDAFVEGK